MIPSIEIIKIYLHGLTNIINICLEVEDYFNSNNKGSNQLNKSAKIKRFVKMNIYYKLPLGTRAHLYFLYRYYFKLGFLDGKEGKIFAFMQAYWYRFLVDAKIYERKNNNF